MSKGSEKKADPQGGANLYPSIRYAWFVAICLQLAYAIALVDRQILALLVQPIKASLRLTDTEFSLLAGLAFVLCYSTLGLVFGQVADRHNRRNTIIYGIIVWSLATMACGVTNTFKQLFIARMLVGVGEAALNPAAYSLIADYFPKASRSRAVAVYSMGSITGSGAGLIASAAVLRATSGADSVHMPILGSLHMWQAVFIAGAGEGTHTQGDDQHYEQSR
jgi:MFS family permease